MIKITKICTTCGAKLSLPYYKVPDSDKMYLCKKCFSWNSHLSRKGLPNKEDVINNEGVYKDYLIIRNTYLLSIKKLIKANKSNPPKVLNTILKKEKEVSLKDFNKSRNCLNFQEHSKVIGSVNKIMELDSFKGTTITSKDTDTWCGKLEIAYSKHSISDNIK